MIPPVNWKRYSLVSPFQYRVRDNGDFRWWRSGSQHHWCLHNKKRTVIVAGRRGETLDVLLAISIKHERSK